MAASRAAGVRCMYRCVVARSRCPASSWIARAAAARIARCEQNVWRRRWTAKRFYERAENVAAGDASCDLAWLSQVWHHVRDQQACASDLRRVLRRGGHVLLRGTFGDRLDGFPTLFQFWPAARAICQQLPKLQETIDVFEASGFTLAQHERVQQVTAASLREFATRTQSRADSALALISDAEFHDGQAAIEGAAAAEASPAPVVEIIDFLVFDMPSIKGGVTSASVGWFAS